MANLKAQLLRRLERLGVEERSFPDRADGFSGLLYRGKPFAHFHDEHELDLRLTPALIRREGLVHPTDSRVHPDRSRNSAWIEIRLAPTTDLSKVVDLVKLAIEQLDGPSRGRSSR